MKPDDKSISAPHRTHPSNDGPAAAPALDGPPSAPFAVRTSAGKGRGVFALRSYAAGELIERGPAIVFSRSDRELIAKTALDDYYFDWGEDSTLGAIVLGYGSLYNHSYAPSAFYVRRPDLTEVHFFARRAIVLGEEITVNYNGVAECQDPLDFCTLP